jgi:hypothetical protein
MKALGSKKKKEYSTKYNTATHNRLAPDIFIQPK